MSISVNPVTYYYSNNFPAAGFSGTGNVAAYEELLALQAQNALLTTSNSDVANDNSAATDTSALNTADLLNLSPAALNILNGIETASNATNTAGATDTLALGNTTNLTANQQTQVAGIVAQYANQPLTQATFTQIENAISAAGINPQQISFQQLFNFYAYAYTPGLSFDGQLFTDTLASELDNS